MDICSCYDNLFLIVTHQCYTVGIGQVWDVFLANLRSKSPFLRLTHSPHCPTTQPFHQNRLTFLNFSVLSVTNDAHRRVEHLDAPVMLLDSCFATDFVIDLREGFLAAQLFAHLIVQSVVKHLVKLFSRHEWVGIQHLEAVETMDAVSLQWWQIEAKLLEWILNHHIIVYNMHEKYADFVIKQQCG